MAMAYATVTGRIVVPGTTTGIPGQVTATPLTEGGVLAFPAEDTTTVGPAVADVTGDGTIDPDLQIPTDVPAGTLWRLRFIPKGKGNLPVHLGDFEITASTDLADLVPVQPKAITPTMALKIEEGVIALSGEDTAVAALIGDPGSEVNGALSATIVAQTASAKAHVITDPAYAGGADPTGATSSTAAIRAALDAAILDGGRVVFGDGTYLMDEGVAAAVSALHVDFRGATIVVNLPAGGYAFTFGQPGDIPTFDGLTIDGGTFTKADPNGTENSNYIAVQGFRNVTINAPTLHNVANGGIQIQTGCEVVDIVKPTILGGNGYSTVRGIWMNGATASDYASQLVDIDSLTRNATPLPIYGVKGTTITQPRIKLAGYGIYGMNAHDTTIISPDIDISGAGRRCIAFNNYSPRGVVRGGRLRGDQSSTGILITQCSDVVVDGTLFEGDFAGGRDVFVQYLGSAHLVRTIHKTETTQMVQVSMGGSVTIDGSEFAAPTFVAGKMAVEINSADGATPSGDTATMLPGSVIRNATFRRIYGVRATATASPAGNIPGFEEVAVENCRAYDADLWAGNNMFTVISSATTNLTRYSSQGNKVFPLSQAYRAHRISKVGTGMTALRTSPQIATFQIAYVNATTTVTSTKQVGDFLTCAASKSANNFVLSPRTNGGGASASVARIVGITPITATISSWKVEASGSNYVVKLYDAAGAQIALTADVSFHVHVLGYDEAA